MSEIMHRTGPCGWFPLAVALLAVTGCGPETITEREARSYVEAWAEQAGTTIEDQIDTASAAERFEKRTKKAARRAQEAVDRKEPPYDVFVREVYASTGWSPRLAVRDGWSERGREVWKVLSKADAHALETELFEFEAIREQLEQIRELDSEIRSISSFEPSETAKRKAREWLTRQRASEFELKPGNFGRLAAALAETEAGSRLATRMEKLEKLADRRADAVARLELLAARNTARYARKMKHFRVRHLFIHEREDDYWRDPVTEGERPDEAKGPYVAGIVRRRAAKIADRMKKPVEILHRRIRETLRQTVTGEHPREILRELEPQNPQYAKLKEAYQKYRSIVASGGWEEVPERPGLRPGDRHETVTALKRRLRTEGYYPEDVPLGESYGERLTEAVENYQETHQIRVTGRPNDSFWSSLNKSAEWRMKQIGLNLRRWRESDVRHSDPLYTLVNIPGAHLEVWRDREREMRFRVVVGNNDSTYDEDESAVVHPNRTPEVSAYIDRVIYNPYWNLTDRIRKTEILPKARKSLERAYKGKLEELRREKRRLERPATSEKERSAVDRLLVARGGTGESSGTPNGERGGAESGVSPSSGGADEPDSVSSGEAGATGGIDGESSDGESTAGSETDSTENSGAAERGGTGEDSGSSDAPPEVSIDDLYRTVDDEVSQIEEVDKKVVFDVDEIRNLIEEVEELSSGDRSSSAESGEPSAGRAGGPSDSESDRKGGERKKANDEKDTSEEETKTPLQEKFPYLDPETGMVDVSTTDPDNVPEWYENNDYEVMFPGKKWEYVRMKQGRQNALGRVKVIFPNRHDIYLHDTPKKQLFSRNIRAFSHGCMRMNEPLSFAEYLLRQDGSLNEVDVDRVLNEKKRVRAEDDPDRKWKRTYEYRPVFLDREIPVYVDYFTVRVDGRGRTNFYADIYDRDARELGREGGETEQN